MSYLPRRRSKTLTKGTSILTTIGTGRILCPQSHKTTLKRSHSLLFLSQTPYSVVIWSDWWLLGALQVIGSIFFYWSWENVLPTFYLPFNFGISLLNFLFVYALNFICTHYSLDMRLFLKIQVRRNRNRRPSAQAASRTVPVAYRRKCEWCQS